MMQGNAGLNFLPTIQSIVYSALHENAIHGRSDFCIRVVNGVVVSNDNVNM